MEKESPRDDRREKAIECVEQCAKDGEVVAYRDLAAHLGGRRGLVDILDRMNEKTRIEKGAPLSVAVVGDA